MDNFLNINLFDGVVIGLIILLSLKGLISGFTKELFNALGIIGGLFTATFFNKDVAKYINDNLGLDINSKILELISLVVIFLVVFAVMKLIYKIIASLSKDDYISSTSRLGGMLIKMITLFFIFSLIVFGLSSKPQVTEKFKDTLSKSSLYPLLKSSGAAILNAPELVNGSVSESNTKEESATKESNATENSAEQNSTIESNTTVASSEDSNKSEEKESNISSVENVESNVTKAEKVVESNTTEAAKEESNSTIKTSSETNSSIETNTTKE